MARGVRVGSDNVSRGVRGRFRVAESMTPEVTDGFGLELEDALACVEVPSEKVDVGVEGVEGMVVAESALVEENPPGTSVAVS